MTYYAGLASVMMALVFLYLTASIFIYGAELNTVIAKLREDNIEPQPARLADATVPSTLSHPAAGASGSADRPVPPS